VLSTTGAVARSIATAIVRRCAPLILRGLTSCDRQQAAGANMKPIISTKGKSTQLRYYACVPS